MHCRCVVPDLCTQIVSKYDIHSATNLSIIYCALRDVDSVLLLEAHCLRSQLYYVNIVALRLAMLVFNRIR